MAIVAHERWLAHIQQADLCSPEQVGVLRVHGCVGAAALAATGQGFVPWRFNLLDPLARPPPRTTAAAAAPGAVVAVAVAGHHDDVGVCVKRAQVANVDEAEPHHAPDLLVEGALTQNVRDRPRDINIRRGEAELERVRG